MALDDQVLLLAGLIEIELPLRTVRLCDGGFVDWPAKGLFTSSDEDYGTIESVESVSESVSDDAPGGRVTLLPVSTAEAADLFQSSAQGAPIRFWLAEVNRATGILVGTPELLFDGMIDTMTLRIARGARAVDIEFIASAERLFFVKEGNVLSSRFHRLAWPDELGFDFCTGSGVSVPWGVDGPSGSGGGSGMAAVSSSAFLGAMQAWAAGR